MFRGLKPEINAFIHSLFKGRRDEPFISNINVNTIDTSWHVTATDNIVPCRSAISRPPQPAASLRTTPSSDGHDLCAASETTSHDSICNTNPMSELSPQMDNRISLFTSLFSCYAPSISKKLTVSQPRCVYVAFFQDVYFMSLKLELAAV